VGLQPIESQDQMICPTTWAEAEKTNAEANQRSELRYRRRRQEQSIRDFGLFYQDGRELIAFSGPDLARTKDTP
jgi:hypothetical protein